MRIAQIRLLAASMLITTSVLHTGCSTNTRSSVEITIGVEELCSKDGKSLIITHPTVSTIKTFDKLVKNGLLVLPNRTRIVGIYHSGENYDYALSQQYIAENAIDYFYLLPIKPEITPDSIFHRNACSGIFEKLVSTCAGIIFTGGPDVPPSIYNEPTSLLTQITDPERHSMEISFLFHLLGGRRDTLFKPLLADSSNLAVLGICLGMQSINVAAGGTLYQDIPTDIYHLSTVESVLAQEINQQHRNYNCSYGYEEQLLGGTFHQVQFSDELFSSIAAGKKPFVLSSHHQCLKMLGDNIRVAGYSADGKVVEAIRHIKYKNVVGVQFHPEASLLYDRNELFLITPNQQSGQSYLNLYPGESGENFHREFWRWFSALLVK